MRIFSIILALFLVVSLAHGGDIICIDAGHGGSDPGAVGNSLQEKDINLDVAKRLATLLRSSGYDARLVRSGDSTYSLSARTSYANSIRARYFISIHCNAFNKSARGTETFAYTKGSSKSFGLRNAVHPEVVRAMGTVDRGTKTANFYVIKYTNMPAILCELAFIDYPGDAAKLGNSYYRQKCAEAIRNGLNKTIVALNAEEETTDHYMAPRWSADGNLEVSTSSGKQFSMDLSGRTAAMEKSRKQALTCIDGKLMLENSAVVLKGNTIYNATQSPDGKRIAFETLEKGIYVCKNDGSDIQHIADGNNPCWSADSESLIFDQTNDDGHSIIASRVIMVKMSNPKWLIYLLESEIPVVENVKSTPSFLPQRPSISPDGKKIAFDVDGKIYVADVDGVKATNVKCIK